MSSLVVPTQCSALRKNGLVLLKGKPCKIIDMSTSKTGKHGHAKVHLTGTDIFTDKKYEELCSSTHNMDVPVCERKEFQLIDIEEDGQLTVLDENGETREDLHLPNLCEADKDLSDKIKQGFEDGDEIFITVVSAMEIDAVKSMRVVKMD